MVIIDNNPVLCNNKNNNINNNSDKKYSSDICSFITPNDRANVIKKQIVNVLPDTIKVESVINLT